MLKILQNFQNKCEQDCQKEVAQWDRGGFLSTVACAWFPADSSACRATCTSVFTSLVRGTVVVCRGCMGCEGTVDERVSMCSNAWRVRWVRVLAVKFSGVNWHTIFSDSVFFFRWPWRPSDTAPSYRGREVGGKTNLISISIFYIFEKNFKICPIKRAPRLFSTCVNFLHNTHWTIFSYLCIGCSYRVRELTW